MSWCKPWVRPKMTRTELDREALFWKEGRPVTEEEYQEFMQQEEVIMLREDFKIIEDIL